MKQSYGHSGQWKVRAAAVALAALGGVLWACQTRPAAKAPTTAASTSSGEVKALWSVRSARRQASFVKMDLPVVVKGMRVQIGRPSGPGPWLAGASEPGGIAVYSTRIFRGSVEGPMVEQLTGEPKAGSDVGSYLVPLAATEKEGVWSFAVDEPMPLYMRVEVAAAQEPGQYRFPVVIASPAGRGDLQAEMEVEVSEVSLPVEPRVLAAATTTAQDLARVYPQTFGAINGTNLDRAAFEDVPAVTQLDALVTAAQQEGVALFVEDLGPRVKVNNVGGVEVDWDAYDRTMQPYMDGTAFADRVPLQVWVAPVSPRRLRDSPTQLRQYVAACAEHFVAKGWVATPAFMHPALIAPEEGVDEKLREEISRTLTLHMTREMLAVTTPDAQVPQARLWVVDDSDPRLPPAGGLASEQSVRLWPWVCAARDGQTAGGVKGFVWRGAVGRAGETDASTRSLLLVRQGGMASAPKVGAVTEQVFPSLRLAWLKEGLNDTAMLGLLEKRSDPAVVKEVLAGIVGRTGLTAATKGSEMPTAPAGFLYAGWPVDPAIWAALPGMLEKLVLAHDPGERVLVAPDDPLYLATKLWLAKAHRPVARVTGYRFSLRPGTEGTLVDVGAECLVENPVDTAVEMEARFAQLPGDFDLVPALGATGEEREERTIKMAAYAAERVMLPLRGHVDVLLQSPRSSTLQLSERDGGAILSLPVRLPIYRMRATSDPPKIDGRAGDWPMDPQVRLFGTMGVGMRYLSRADLLGGAVRMDNQAAQVRWTYDAENLYVLVRCPQEIISDERNTQWPANGAEGENGAVGAGGGAGRGRWWGTDGVQIQLAGIGAMDAKGGEVIVVAFKPAGVVLTRVGRIGGKGREELQWQDGPTGVQYGISLEKQDGRVKGYVVEAAIPRRWFNKSEQVEGLAGPAWRVNVLRHRANDLTSMSWSGPVVNDRDVAMMGVLVGE